MSIPDMSDMSDGEQTPRCDTEFEAGRRELRARMARIRADMHDMNVRLDEGPYVSPYRELYDNGDKWDWDKRTGRGKDRRKTGWRAWWSTWTGGWRAWSRRKS